MSRGKIMSFFAFALSLSVIVGGGFLVDEAFEKKENRFLGKVWEITNQDGSKTAARTETAGQDFSAHSLSEEEKFHMLEVWESGKKEVPCEPVQGQMNMEQAMKEGQLWIESVQKSDVLFSQKAKFKFDKITAKLCSYDEITDLEKKNAGFWEVYFERPGMQIVLRIHAVSGEIWSAKINAEEENIKKDISTGGLLMAAFPFFQADSTRIYRKDNLDYRQNKKGNLFQLFEKSEIKVNESPSTMVLKLWLGLRV